MPRILIVDDEEDQEEIIVQKFANKPFLRGYEFMFARDGWDALKKIKDYPDIEVALVDINMPEMDGLTFLKKSKTYNPSLCAIIVSAYGDISNIRTAMNNGAFDFLTKPIDLVDLEATLRKTLSHAVQLKEIEKTANENLQLKQKAFDLEMQALRAQMNPHFIFNSLNSINNFILSNEKEKASEFLIKFSKLIRLILENSSQILISLEQELNALRLYIDLEALRFHQHFSYTIHHSDYLDIASIKVPPLILQPFVENSIHHGLLPKESSGNLYIQIEESGQQLLFTIRDDGIGRDKAAQLKSNIKINHKSMGINVTKERIALLEKGKGLNSNVIVNDLIDDQGEVAGTEISIVIPLII